MSIKIDAAKLGGSHMPHPPVGSYLTVMHEFESAKLEDSQSIPIVQLSAFPNQPFWLGLCPLAAAAWTDWHTRRIPDPCVFLLGSCGVLRVAVNGFPPGEALAGLLVLGGIFLLCGLLAPASTGGGDIKLCAALGLLLGPLTGSVTLLLALVLGLIYGAARRERAVPLAVCVLPAYLFILIGS